MKTTQPQPRLRLAAIDLDGTLLGPDGTISTENREALQALSDAGIEVVLASGRHYDSMLPYADTLPMVNWIISTQGAEVSNRSRKEILHRLYLPPAKVEQLLSLLPSLGLTDVSYTPESVLSVSAPNPAIALYSSISGLKPQRLSPGELLERNIHKMIWIGQPEQISRLPDNKAVQALGLQTVQTFDTIYELMPVETTKASGLATLAAHLGIDRSQVVTFGDGENDIPMFEWAGESFCMPHGWPRAKESARNTGPAGNPATALARAVHQCLSA